MSDLILHHYDPSPYAHKIRLALGLKGLAWRSVEIPMIMPKPDLISLTGGYRRTPVLQIGADIYCDTARIADELEIRHPDPTFYPNGGFGLSAALGAWADQSLFQPTVAYVFSQIGDKMPADFHKDRAAMRGAEPPDIDALKAGGPRYRGVVERLFSWIDDMLADGRAYLLGEAPALADLSIYHIPWFVRNTGRRTAAVLKGFEAMAAWMARVEAIGQGDRTELDSKEALTIARHAAPAELNSSDEPGEADPPLGSTVAVQSDDRVPEPVVGELVTLNRREIAVQRSGDGVGDVVVHFPRVGYGVRPAK